MTAGRSNVPRPPDFPIEVARFLLNYDAETGLFRWRVTIAGNARKGKIAGCRTTHDKGYLVISIFGRRYLGHHMAWFLHYGRWPEQQVDHRDLDPGNNAIRNLREADNSQNRMNTGRYSNNRSGFKGVHFNAGRQRWEASICSRGQKTWLGSFESAEAAGAAYQRAAAKIHGDFARFV